MRCRPLLFIPAALALVLLAPWIPAPGAAGDEARPGEVQRSNPVTYRVDFSVVVTAPAGTKVLRVWLPLPPSDAGQEVTGRELTAFPAEVKPTIEREPVHGNEFACFTIERPQGGQVLRHRFTARVWEQHWRLDPARVAVPERWPAVIDPYLNPDDTITVDDRIRRLTGELTPRRQGPARDLEAVMRWLGENMTYGPIASADRVNPLRALEARGGDCSAYHGLCAACGRVLGVPTRVVYGLHLFPKNSPSHCKLEAYLPPYGWVSFDVSETQKLAAALQQAEGLAASERQKLLAAAADRLRRGFRDNTWLLLTRGTGYDLAPPASRRVPVIRTAHVEADGVPLADPDPGNPKNRAFSWMTVHRFEPDRPVRYPFQDWSGLEGK